MSVNLTATARLNTGPYMKSLAAISAATGDLSKATVAGEAAATSAVQQRMSANKAASAAAIAGTREADRATRESIKAQNNLATASRNAAQGLSGQRYLYHDLSRQAATYAKALAVPTLATVGIAALWEDAFADVRRTADPAFSESTEKVNELRRSLVEMVQAMPISFGAVTEIATLANQMGIASSQTADFTRAVAMFSATSGVSVDMSATAFGRLTSIMGDARIGFTEMADSILKVGVNSVATESEIINITTQVSSIAAGAKFSTEEMIGLSGALASVRVPPELSRGLITRTFGRIDQAVADGGTRLETLARVSGRTAAQFRSDWRNGGAAKALTDFLIGIQKEGGNARSVIESLGITSVRDVPVLLRLANAADSEGNVGGLLTQTMTDAQNAAGETQRQYSIMADTIWAKIKVLGNNVLAMFDAIGQSNLGVFGNLLDTVTDGIRDFTLALPEKSTLFGFELPWTNAEALGFIANLTLIASGITAVGAASLKIGAAATGLKQLGAVLGAGKALPWLLGTTPAKAGAGAAGQIAATAAAATAARPVLASLRSGAVAAGTSWGNLGRSVRNAGAEFVQWGNVMKDPTVIPMKGVPAAQGALGNLVKFGLHPATIAVGALTTATIIAANEFFGSTTEIDHFAESLASIKVGNVKALDRELANLQVNGFWSSITSDSWDFASVRTPFENGIEDVQNLASQLTSLRKASSPFGVELDLAFGDMINAEGLRDDVEALAVIDGSIQQLVDSGNRSKAISYMQQLAASGEDLMTLRGMDEGKSIDRLAKSLIASSDGFEDTIETWDKFIAKSPEVIDAFLGVQGLGATSELFDLDVDAGNEFIEVLDKASEAFIDFGSAMSASTTSDEDGNFLSFDLQGFGAELARSVELQAQWQADMETIAGDTTVGVVQRLAELGPKAANQVGAIADALRSESPEVRQAGLDLIAQMEAGVEAGMSTFGGRLGTLMADTSWLRQALGDQELANSFAKMLVPEDLSDFREAGVNASRDVINGVVDGLLRGEISWKTALQSLSENKVLVEADVNPYKLSVESLKAFANGTITQVHLDALPDLARGAVWEVVQLADGSTGFVKLNALTGEALSEVAYVVDEANGTFAEIPLTGDNAEVLRKIQEASAAASSAKPKVNVGADTSAVSGAANYWNGRTIATSYVNVVTTHSTSGLYTGGGRMVQADGGVVSYFANGGVRRGENHVAQIAPASGTTRVWAEPETEGEAYIPLARRKRTRSLAILDNVANRFGYSLTKGAEAARFAEGGFYSLQSRSMYGRMRSNSQVPEIADKIYNFTFNNPVERSWRKQARERSDNLGAGF